jgi:hypothetical protein
MSTAKSSAGSTARSAAETIAGTVHDTIDGVTTAVEGIHKTVADFPFEVLGELTPLGDILDQVREAQGQTISAIYGLIRKVNGQVRRLTVPAAR